MYHALLPVFYNIPAQAASSKQQLPWYTTHSIISICNNPTTTTHSDYITKSLSINNLEETLSFWHAFLQWRQAYEREIMGSVECPLGNSRATDTDAQER